MIFAAFEKRGVKLLFACAPGNSRILVVIVFEVIALEPGHGEGHDTVSVEVDRLSAQCLGLAPAQIGPSTAERLRRPDDCNPVFLIDVTGFGVNAVAEFGNGESVVRFCRKSRDDCLFYAP